MSPRDFLIGLAMGLTLATVLAPAHQVAMFAWSVVVTLIALAAFVGSILRGSSKGQDHGS